jgi:hypothetical protein
MRPESRSTATTSAPSGGQLRRLAARRGAEIGHALARPDVQQPRRQGGGGVLGPEIALGKPGSSVMRVPAGSRAVPLGSITAPSGAAAPGFSERSSGASIRCAAAMARTA